MPLKYINQNFTYNNNGNKKNKILINICICKLVHVNNTNNERT